MTTTLEPVVPAVTLPDSRRRRWLLVSILVVLLLSLSGVAIGWIVYAHSYSPFLVGGGSSGPVTEQTLEEATDGLQPIEYVVVGPPGTIGTSSFSLTDTGRYKVKLLGTDGGDPVVHLRMTWAPESNRSENITGPARPFPVTLHRGETVAIETSETQPDCASGIPEREDIGTTLRWSALGVTHDLNVPNELGGFNMPIMTCPPARVLRHLEP